MKNQKTSLDFRTTHCPTYMMASEIRPGDIMKDANGNYNTIKNVDYLRNPELINTNKDSRTHAVIIFDDNQLKLKFQEEFWFLMPNENIGVPKPSDDFMYRTIVERCINSLKNKTTKQKQGKKPYTLTEGISNRNENVQIYVCDDSFAYGIYDDEDIHIESFYKNIKE